MSALISVLLSAFVRSPLVAVWLMGLVVGGMMLQRQREPALCLLVASALELIRHIGLILWVPIPMWLVEAEIMSFNGLGILGVIRGILTTIVVVVSHVLLLVAIFGFRPLPDGEGD